MSILLSILEEARNTLAEQLHKPHWADKPRSDYDALYAAYAQSCLMVLQERNRLEITKGLKSESARPIS